jgi:hypothetical protein
MADEPVDNNAGSMELIGDGPDKPTDKPAEEKPDLAQTVESLRAELATAKAQTASANETREYWKSAHDRIAQRPTTSRLATDEGKEPEEDLDDLVEILAKGDKKKIKEAFGKLGFVQKGEVDDKLESKWQTVESAAHVQTRHRDIADPNSLLHQETLRQIDSLRSQGIDSPNLLSIAADMAFTNLVKTGKIKASDKSPEPNETDAERIERVGTQQGSLNRSRRNPAEGGDNEGLTDSQKLICKKFGLDETKYAARASKGVRLAGVPK